MHRFSKRNISFFLAFFLDLRRILCSFPFLASILFMLLWMTGNIAYPLIHFSQALEAGTVYLLRIALESFHMGPLILVIAAIPYASMYGTEKESGFQREIQKRVSPGIYSVSKVLSTVVSAFLLAFVSIALFLGMLTALKIPHALFHENTAAYYEELCITRGVGWYYLVKIMLTGHICALAGVFALFISSCVPNTYAAILSPLIGYYLWNCILNLACSLLPSSRIWQMISPMNLFFAQVWLGGSLPSFLWTAFFLTVLTVFFGIQFAKRLRGEAAA